MMQHLLIFAFFLSLYTFFTFIFLLFFVFV
jgi:hypothetical protein